jgi:hypothetical protein
MSPGACKSKISTTPGCRMDCAVGDITLSLQSLRTMGTVSIVNAEYPSGTAVTFTSNSISFKVQAGVQDLVVSYVFAPLNARAKLVENCDNQTVWDNNVNSTMQVVPYSVCA